MTPESDPQQPSDIRSRFQSRRQEDQSLVPAWAGMIRVAETMASRRTVRHTKKTGFFWIGSAAVAAALCLATGGLFFEPSPAPVSLAEALPVLLDAPDRPLLADLDVVTSSPSDFLLPERLKFDLP